MSEIHPILHGESVLFKSSSDDSVQPGVRPTALRRCWLRVCYSILSAASIPVPLDLTPDPPGGYLHTIPIQPKSFCIFLPEGVLRPWQLGPHLVARWMYWEINGFGDTFPWKDAVRGWTPHPPCPSVGQSWSMFCTVSQNVCCVTESQMPSDNTLIMKPLLAFLASPSHFPTPSLSFLGSLHK